MTRWHWGHAIAVVYSTFAISTIAFVVFAVNHPVDLVSADYYAASLRHDERRTAIENAAPFASAMAVDLDARRLTVTWPAGAPRRTGGTARLYRPSASAIDRDWVLPPGADPASLSIDAPLAPGRWVLQLSWKGDGHDFYVERAIEVK